MPIAESDRAHRRGVVLGFTMAELLLLLLFCLLLVSATSLFKKDELINTLKDQLNIATSTNDDIDVTQDAFQLELLLSKLYPKGAPKLQPADFRKLWETLVLARTQNIALTDAGIDGENDLDQLLAVWHEVKSRAASAEEVQQLVEVLQKLTEAGANNFTAAQVAELTEKMAKGGPTASATPVDRWPPIISLDGNTFRFKTGSAEIVPGFYDYLALDAAKKIAELLKRYDADVIEIVGHTDEQVIEPNVEKSSNLDKVAIGVVNGTTTEELIPVDNAGLGLARAIEVARVLRQQPELAGMKIVPLSAGQLLRKGDLLSDGVGTVNDADRRRIEIRVRRSTPEAN